MAVAEENYFIKIQTRTQKIITHIKKQIYYEAWKTSINN